MDMTAMRSSYLIVITQGGAQRVQYDYEMLCPIKIGEEGANALAVLVHTGGSPVTFMPGGGIGIGDTCWHDAGDVLRIIDISTGEVTDNWHLCPHCGTLSCKCNNHGVEGCTECGHVHNIR